jgi:hypothetical protein
MADPPGRELVTRAAARHPAGLVRRLAGSVRHVADLGDGPVGLRLITLGDE